MLNQQINQSINQSINLNVIDAIEITYLFDRSNNDYAATISLVNP